MTLLFMELSSGHIVKFYGVLICHLDFDENQYIFYDGGGQFVLLMSDYVLIDFSK